MYYLGIDLGGTNIAAGVVNEQYQIIGRSKTKTHVPCSEEEMCSQLAFAALSALEDANIAINEIEWIGIGSPGSIDFTNGMITFSSNLHFHQFPLERLLSEKLCKKVIIENDAKAAAYGEFLAGALKNANNALAITLGTGVGCGIIINKQIYRGSNASSEEMGHMVIEHNGRPCKCGSSGCLGRYVSALGLVRTLKEKLEDGTPCIIREWVNGDLERVTAKMISDAYDSDDRIAVETMTETGEILGFGLVNIINLFNPEIIILGGGMSAAGERLLQPARKVVDNHALRISRSNCSITTAQLGDAAGMLGAAIYAKQRLTNCGLGISKIINGGDKF